ncbi:hypothetical protein INS49_007798 [Diaporthe citri]|uniref:uncharacterized protein n=1 Tax=Diaporthe citri TaxID=83186 RepID=UPI001C80A691|nr:uncharacterized protein INS49_007798 [Diaporthe citri]KAG6362705.1 hypothetical protein INS49_007798 [Diaporthe citri]
MSWQEFRTPPSRCNKATGGVRDIPGLWEFLREQKDVQMEFKEPRFPAKGFYHPDVDRPGTALAGSGFVLEEDPRLFDPAFFGITDIEAETMDASQRKLFEVTYETFENAGETWESVSGSRTGVFVGDFAFDNYISQTRDWDYSGKHSATGSFPNMLANRIHYVFNLKGPSVLLNSVCTSAMYALHTAIISMRNGDCDSAIVAGSNWIMDPNSHIAMGKLGALSATSRSHTFDESADGYALNANGRTTGITNPSGPAQETVLREAYNDAGGLDPSQTMLLECHRTGTRVGDPIEVEAAGNVFGPHRSDSYEDRLVVTSVKTNFGHLEGACAFPGILKVVSAIEAGEIPPILGFKSPNKRIDFDKAKARVVTSRASVTSAGFGGTNGHCIIDHVHNYIPGYVKPGVIHDCAKNVNGVIGVNGHVSNGTNGVNGHTPNGFTNGTINGTNKSNGDSHRRHFTKADAATRQLVLLPFSAHNQASLLANVDALSGVAHKHSLADVAYTLSAKRSRFSHRAYAVVDKSHIGESGPGLSLETKAFFSSQALRVGFVFTGQGAQRHAMGAELFEYGTFRDTISFLDLVLAGLPHPAPWKIADILAGSCERELIQIPAVS